MKLTTEIKGYIDSSVLCWLATASTNGMPNVSPKEIFTYYDSNSIIVANIASPHRYRGRIYPYGLSPRRNGNPKVRS